MYDEFFGLKETPFSIAPDPRFLYMSERHREALAHLVYGVGTDGGFVLLSGEVGTGKTTISRCLLDQIPENADVAMILNPKLLSGELLATICDELHIEYPADNTSIKVFVDCINKYLLETHAKGKKAVVLIEESQNLNPEVLEQLRLLTNLETRQRKLLQIIMIGQPELLELLSRPELRQLEQRITARYHLMPLTRKDTIEYVKHRLSVAGVKDPIFSKSALNKIYKLTGGIPRKINLLCDRAMLGAYTKNQKYIDNQILKTAAQEVFGDEAKASVQNRTGRERASRKPLVLASLGSAIAIGIAALVVYMNFGVIKSLFNHRSEMTLEQMTNDTLRWIDTDLIENESSLAFQELFKEWNKSYTVESVDACKFATTENLACLYMQDDLESLLNFNRPAVIAIKNNSQKIVYVSLTQLQQDSAVLKSGGQVHRISNAALLQRWANEYTVVWRVPPEYTGVIKPGSNGPAVKWLADQFASIDGAFADFGDNEVYGPKLKRRVKDFQTKAGLQADGVAGTQTLIRINSVVDSDIPQIFRPQGRAE